MSNYEDDDEPFVGALDLFYIEEIWNLEAAMNELELEDQPEVFEELIKSVNQFYLEDPEGPRYIHSKDMDMLWAWIYERGQMIEDGEVGEDFPIRPTNKWVREYWDRDRWGGLS